MKRTREGFVRLRAAFAVAVGLSVLVVAPPAPHVAADDIASITCDDVPASEPPTDVVFDAYEPQLAERIVDTRNNIGGVDEPLDAGCTLIVDTTAAAPAGAQGLALSITVVTTVPGFFTAFPCAEGLPATSSVNARPGLPTANLVLVAPDSFGQVCVFSEAGGEVIIDVSGWWTPGATPFSSIEPVRAYDTRQLAQPVKLPAEAIRDVDVAGPFVPEDAVAVAVNLAAVNPTDDGFLVVYPCGVEPPLASNLNFVAGEKRAVSAIVEVGVLGKVCVTGNAETHFIVDVTGFYAPSADFGPSVELSPIEDTRVVDTRFPNVPGTRFNAGDVQRFSLAGDMSRPDHTVAAALNVVAVQAEDDGFLTVYPCVDPVPTTSSLNYDLGQTANLVVTSLAQDAEFCVFASTAVHLVVDLVGAFEGSADALATQISISKNDQFTVVDQEYVETGADYTMRCDDDGLIGSLRLAGILGTTVRVNGTTTTALDTELDIPADGLLTVNLDRGGENETHHFRCVPPDFPELTVTGTGGNAAGWYLTGLGWTNPNDGTFLAIMNERGVPIWFKRTERKLIDAKLLSTGALVATPITGRGFGIDPTAGYRMFNLDGDLLDVHVPFNPTVYPADHHDYAEIGAAQGRAMLSYPTDEGYDLTGVPVVDPRCNYDTVETMNRTIVDGTIQEIAVNTAVWTWNMSDHFEMQEVTYAQCFENYPAEPGGSEVDVFHLNSMQRIEEPGCEPFCDYLVSARHLDAVVRVDRFGAGNVDWILTSRVPDLGNPVPNDAKLLEIIDDPLGGPKRAHDALLDGNMLTMHDNRTATGEPSRVVTYQIDPVAMTATLVDQIDHPLGLTSGQVGSARFADDGSVLVNWGATQPMFVEYAADGTELLRIEMPSNDQAYRIVKYPPSTFDIADLRAAAGGSVEAPV